METFICINDDFGIGIFIESRDDDKFDKKIYLDFGKFDRRKNLSEYILITLVRDLYLRFVRISEHVSE